MNQGVEMEQKQHIESTVEITVAPQEAVAQESVHDALLGTVISDRYEIVQVVGKGGMGLVYKAVHRQLNRPFAVKVMLPGRDGFDARAKARFDQEAKAASVLNHQNLVGIHDYGTTSGGAPYLVMDYVDGEPLADFLSKRGPLDEQAAIDICMQICDGLNYAHERSIVHRDLKPSNIMISENKSGSISVRILDFGVAKVLEQFEAGDAAKTLTRTGEIVGSPLYMSPEQCMGQGLDRRSDIYSLGCIMFEMLTGSRVFEGDNPMAIMVQHLNQRPPIFSTIDGAPKVRPELERVVLQMLEKAPENRYQSAEDVARDLQLVRLGKNPLKEIARTRKNVERVSSILKVAVVLSVGALGAFGGVRAWEWYQYQIQPQWKKSFDLVRQTFAANHDWEAAELGYLATLKESQEAGAAPAEREPICIQLSRLFLDVKEPERALYYSENALGLSKMVETDPLRGEIYDEIAAANLMLRDYTKAAEAAELAVQNKQKSMPDENISRGRSLISLGRAYTGLKQYAKAESVYSEAVRLLTMHEKYPARELTDAKEGLAYVLLKEKKYTEAHVAVRDAMAISVKRRGPDHPLTMKLGALYGEILREGKVGQIRRR